MNGAQLLIQTLLANGVDLVVGNPGTSEMQFVSALDSVPKMRAVLALFEGVVTGAATATAAWTKASGELLTRPRRANGGEFQWRRRRTPCHVAETTDVPPQIRRAAELRLRADGQGRLGLGAHLRVRGKHQSRHSGRRGGSDRDPGADHDVGAARGRRLERCARAARTCSARRSPARIVRYPDAVPSSGKRRARALLLAARAARARAELGVA